MRIGIANDHVAVEMKQQITEYLESKGYEVVNYGTDSSESFHYPISGEKVALAVKNQEVDLGILKETISKHKAIDYINTKTGLFNIDDLN